MTTQDDFELADGKGTGDGGRPAPVGQPTPVDTPTPDLGESPGKAPQREPRRALHRPTERKPAKRRARAAKPPAEQGDTPERVFFLFRSGFLLFVGAVILAVLWAGGFFAQTDAARAQWPWELFLGEDGAFSFAWTADHIGTLVGGFLVLFLLIASLLRAGPGRGAGVLTVVGLAVVMHPPEGPDQALYLGWLLLGLGAASCLAREGVNRGLGGKGFVFVMAVLLAASLFLPAAGSGAEYDSQAVRAWDDATAGDPLMDVIGDPSIQIVTLQAVVLVLALLTLVGLGGRWILWAGGVALYVAALAPLGFAAEDYLSQADPVACLGLHQWLVNTLPAASLALVLPAAAGAIDVRTGN